MGRLKKFADRFATGLGNLAESVITSSVEAGAKIGSTVGSGISEGFEAVGNKKEKTETNYVPPAISPMAPTTPDAANKNNAPTAPVGVEPPKQITGGTGNVYGDAIGKNPEEALLSQNYVTPPDYKVPTVEKEKEIKTKEPETMTYETYIAEKKAREEEKRQAALKEAEIYKERAAADAQASYMQNMSTYGVNAETMAQMGLTGGGYSDYLNAQAYAQKRGEMQTASAKEAAMKQQAESKYADNILSLDGQLVAYQEAEKAEKEQYAKSVYNTLWDAVQDPNTTYTADSIKAIAEKAGLSENDIATLTGMLDSTLAKKVENDKKTEEEKATAEKDAFETTSANTTSATISYIVANGGGQAEYIESIKDTLTEDDYKKLVTQNQKSTYEYYTVALNSGNNISTSEVDTLYKNGNLSDQQYNDIKALWNDTKGKADNYGFVDLSGNALSYEDAKKLLDTVKASTWHNDVNKKAIESMFMRQYAEKIGEELSKNGGCTSKTVDIYASNFKTTNFGDYRDMGKSGTWQEKYAQAIVADAKAGKIQAGQYVIMNYGNTRDIDCVFIYIGDGLFQKCDKDLSEGYANGRSELNKDISFYVPSGYKLNVGQNVVHVEKE